MIIKATEKDEHKALKIRNYLQKHGSIRLNVPKAEYYASHALIKGLGVKTNDAFSIELIDNKQKDN